MSSRCSVRRGVGRQQRGCGWSASQARDAPIARPIGRSHQPPGAPFPEHADIGISLPGTGEQPTAPVFVDGRKAATLRGPTLSADFKQMVIDYIEGRWGTGARTAAE
jgi:hypothetical protein